ncbi:uncharacterized protein LOC119637960 [Glossina fuscipes]|uniref:Uncharacterized protein LOC119637960 n=1 Tax=Glossina fuscipes TaxID=7396 RepID=A0A9C5Z6F8_9MUSC|nr:uncharacterized protein LOC119637960 [Glossina fuscipes]
MLYQGSVLTISDEHLPARKFCSKREPCLLTFDNTVLISQSVVWRCLGIKSLAATRESRPKRLNTQKSVGMVMVSVFWVTHSIQHASTILKSDKGLMVKLTKQYNWV